MAKNDPRVTIRDVAASGGFHPSTVSLALRDDPRLPEETRKKIKGVAEKLGYKASPLVSAWLRHVRQPEAAQRGVGMAFLLGLGGDGLASREPYYQTFVAGARAEASELGYVVSEFSFGPNDMPSLMKFIARLRYRGVRGVLLFDPAECISTEVVRELEKDFAVVVALRAGGGHRFHRITTDVIGNVVTALKKLRELGCRRIGFPYMPGARDRVRTDASSSFLGQQLFMPVEQRLPVPENVVEFSADLFVSWVKKHRPDAILSVNFATYQFLLDEGYKMPDDLIFAHLGTDSRRWLPGVVNRGFEVGNAAVFQLAGLLTGNRFGVPEFPQCTLVPGYWCDGDKPIAPRDETRTGAALSASTTKRIRKKGKASPLDSIGKKAM